MIDLHSYLKLYCSVAFSKVEKTQECFTLMNKIIVFSLFSTLSIQIAGTMLPKFRQENRKDSEEYQRVSICLD